MSIDTFEYSGQGKKHLSFPSISNNCAREKPTKCSPLLLLQKSFNHLNFPFPVIVPLKCSPSLKPHIQFHMLLFSFYITFLFPPHLSFRDDLLLNSYQQFICLWKVLTALLNSVPFTVLVSAVPVSGQNVAGTPDSTTMLEAPQNPSAEMVFWQIVWSQG